MFSQALNQNIKEIVDNQNFITYNTEKVPINTNGGNYLGELFEVHIKGETKNGPKELNLFVKMKIDADIKFLSVNSAFSNEAYFYNELIVKYDELQESAKVPINERYKAATSYGKYSKEAIILQNLVKEGFKTKDRMDYVSLEYAQAAVQQLAKFHGLSFVLKEKEPKYFEDKIKPMKYIYKFDDVFRSFYKAVASNAVRNFEGADKQKLEDLLPNFVKKLQHYFEDSESTVLCLCHGDYRTNNIMLRETNRTLELIPVDYQILHYGCPILDFLYFITLSTSKEFRKEHLEDLKNLYYDTLADFLNYFNIDVKSVFPREEFERVYKERYDYALIGILLFGTWTFASEEQLPNVTDLAPVIKIKDEGVKRIQGIYEDVAERGFL